ncbi:MAG: hypothetical protein IKO61_05165 [Lachnospiraceae bacterium]|nr:hypothetical protein [Lachnospiraceae bacterium]
MGEEKKDTLTAREKGDIYWRKLKYYLAAVKEKEKKQASERTGRSIAQDILSLDGEAVMSELKQGRLWINGNEFKKRPPTATGEEAYKNSILLVHMSLKYFKEVLKKAKKTPGDEIEQAVMKHVEKTLPVIELAVTTWFASNGIDIKTGEEVRPQKKAEAEKKLEDILKAYEDEIKSFRRNVAKTTVKRLMTEDEMRLDEEDAEDEFGDIEASYVDVEEEYQSLFEEHRERFILNKNKIGRALMELSVLKGKIKHLNELMGRLGALVEEKGPYEQANSVMTYRIALWEYQDFVEEQLAAAVWVKDACEGLIRGVLLGENVDPLIANYIRAHWGADVSTLPLNVKIKELPGFVSLDSMSDADVAKYSFAGLDEIRTMVSQLEEYKNTHERQFSCQTITGMLFDKEELVDVAGKARALRNRLAHGIAGDEFASLTREERLELTEKWVVVDTIARVAYMVIEYSRESEKKTLDDLVKSYAEDSCEMSYLLQERRCRQCVESYLRGKNNVYG